MLLKYVLSASIVLGLQAQAFAKTHPYDAAFKAKFNAAFIDKGQFSPAKVDAYLLRLNTKEAEVADLVRMKLVSKKASAEKIASELAEEKMLIALRVAAASVQKIKRASNEAEAMALAFDAFNLESAIRIQGDKPSLANTFNTIKSVLSKWDIKKEVPASLQASNLWNPETRSYMSESEIEQYKNSGRDLSLLGPNGRSAFWKNLGAIQKIDMKRAGLGGYSDLYGSKPVEFPAQPIFYYDEVRHSDTKPKIDVFITTADGKKQKFKLKFGAEIHADPTVAAFTMALGFTADVTKYSKDIKVILGKTPLSDVKRDWEVYYKRDVNRIEPAGSYVFEDYVKEVGVDANGESFIVFKEGLIESKPKEIERVGPWAFADNGVSSLREVRGLMMVQLWLDNNDVKEFDNNRVLMRENGKGGFDVFNIISDLGHSMSVLMVELPDHYFAKMVDKNDSKAITLHNRSLQVSSIKGKISYDDARWGIRLIAQLSRQQIEAGVGQGQWPKCIGELYVEKMISRRNDLVKNFGLSGEFAPMPLKLDLDKVNLKNYCDMKAVKKGTTLAFEYGVKEALRPVAVAIERAALNAARSAIGSKNKFVLKSADFKLDTGIVSEVILNFKRDIEINLEPETEMDQYIVQDHFEIGLRLGVSYGLYKDAVYTRRYSLSYPVRSMSDARLHNRFVVNAFLAQDIANDRLPEKYVLKTEHAIEHGFGVEFKNSLSPYPIAGKIGHAKIHLMRSILDHRDPERFVLYRDRAEYAQNIVQASLKLGPLKLPFFDALKAWGESSGMGMSFTARDLETDSNLAKSLSGAVMEGDFANLRENEVRFAMKNRFNNGNSGWNILLKTNSSDRRLDRISLSSDGKVEDFVQYQTTKKRSSNYVISKEEKNVRVEAYSVITEKGPAFQVHVDVVGTDSNTKDKEMAKEYLKFINDLSVDSQKLVKLSPELGYTTNGRWGGIVMRSNTVYYHEALTKLLDSSATDLQLALSNIAGDDQSELKQQAEKFVRRVSEAKLEKSMEAKVAKIAEAFRGLVFKAKSGFFDSRLLGAVHRLVTKEAIYSYSEITVPQSEELNLIGEIEMIGIIGEKKEKSRSYLMYSPTTPTDLYFMFDDWF
ncbi:MAG: hypothetical protein V4692_01755 [Bdellovibrionota bacterium]